MSTVIPAVRGRRVGLFDCHSLRWLPTLVLDIPSTDDYFQSDEDVKNTIQALALTSGKVLILYHMYYTTPYLVDSTGHATKLSNAGEMTHHDAGLIEFEGGVYVFGASGWFSSSKTSKRLDLSSGTWTRVKDLTVGREYIKPALWHSRIYIPGGWQSTASIDEYTPHTDTMVALTVKLPESGSPAAAFVDGDHLVVFSLYYVARYQQTRAGLQLVSARKFARQFGFFTLLTSPVVCDGKAFFIHCHSSFGWCVDPSTREELGFFKATDLE